MTGDQKDEHPQKQVKQKPDLGQKEAALEKEKEAELHRMGKERPSDTRSKRNERHSG
jgi:hypothetical protein